MGNKTFSDIKIDIKFRLSALWVSVMFCYVYGDFFSLFLPGRITKMANGESGVGATTPLMLLIFALMMTIPALMVFLSLALRAAPGRLVNIIAGILFTIIMILVVATSLDAWMLYYTYLGIVEIVLTVLITVMAWRWPRE